MTNKIFTLLIFVLVIHAYPQKVSYKLNSLDFTRFPLTDLYVTAKDGNGQPIMLSEEVLSNITITHDGIKLNPIEIKSVYDLKYSGESELYIALVFDNSESMRERISLLEEAASNFINALAVGDYVSIIDFGDGRLQQRVPEYDDPIYARQRINFSNSKKYLSQAVRTPTLTTKTFMYDALLYSQSLINKTEALGKKVIIFFSDGVNIGSVTNSDVVNFYASQYETPIYAIDLNNYENPVLKNLALQSGGEYYFVRRAEDLIPLYQSISRLLQSQYRLTYKCPTEIINKSNYAVKLENSGTWKGSDYKIFQIDGEKIGYYNLLQFEKDGREKSEFYLDYVTSYPKSKYRDDVELLFGNYYLKRNNFKRALAIYNRILRNPVSQTYLVALSQKAELLKQAKLFAEAKKTYEKIIESDENSTSKPRAMLELAQSYYAEGNYLLAFETYSNIISDYQGTEFASEALLQSATLSLAIGDLNRARDNLSTIVTEYPESKSNIYAMVELADLEYNAGNLTTALEQYTQIESTSKDRDILEKTVLQKAEIYKKQKQFEKSINEYNSIIRGDYSDLSKTMALKLIIPVQLMFGSFAEARNTFYSLPDDVQANLLKDNERIEIELNQSIPALSIINGTFLSQSVYPKPSIRLIENNEMREKFSIIGPIYEFSGIDENSRSSISVDPKWISDNLLNDKGAGVYYYSGNQWEFVSRELSEKNLAYEISITNEGMYAILAKAPRVITLYNIYFDYNKASIKKEAEKNLYQIIDELKYYPNLQLEIAGHTDSIGSDSRNIELSLMRAETIKKFMVFNGISEDRLIARGYGSQYPIAPNDTELDREKNRRTEFIIKDLITIKNDVSSTDASERYFIQIKIYMNPKEAFEQKLFYLKRGYNVSVITDAGENRNYKLILGLFATIQLAEEDLLKFSKEFGFTDIKIEKY